ncbi:MAG: secretion system protein E [Candidatus Omnitrophota bacterium]|nr:MAG: secretion system protein E [Candidatus Omnitrophota bacterium]
MESLKEKIRKRIIEYKKEKKEKIEELDKEFSNFYEFRNKLIEENILSEEELLLILSQEYKIPYLDLDKYRVPKENKNLLPQELAFRYKVLPVSKIGKILTLATANPLDVITLDDLKLSLPFEKIDFVLTEERKILKVLNHLYTPENTPQFSSSEDVLLESSKEEVDLETLVKESRLPPIVRVVDLIIYEGLRRRSSDIHIEPTEKNLAVRYRIDGVLHPFLSLPQKNQSAIIARLKVMSSLDITEFRLPQDGRFKVKFEGKEIDFRVSSLPTQFGEKIVLRVLDKESLSYGLKNLGFSEIPLRLFEKALSAPFGIILVTGPTGSGKSTTLYSIIAQLNKPDKNIITIEDPVEYQLEGITQIQVNPEIGLTFASSLKSVLRQSPDIIMVGEIRDRETADIAIKASLTGEFIFSTLHTNNSVGAITRLVDMGIEPFLVASSLVATTAQRLVRKLCPQCKIEYQVPKSLQERFGILLDTQRLFRAQGCKHCHHTGYYGRTALLEVLLIDEKIREMIIKRASEEEIIRYAREFKEFSSLREDGLKKCKEAITSLEEVLRVA